MFQQVEFTADDLRDLGEIGRGGFGTVNKMVHRKSNTIMAVKVTLNSLKLWGYVTILRNLPMMLFFIFHHSSLGREQDWEVNF